MTAFVLVPGAHTGGWVWDDVAGRLREAGAGAYPVTLSGMGRQPDPGVDLETHIRDVLDVVDRVEEPGVVIVGHCYGIHPVLGAADRRPGRIGRVVHLDIGIPADGDPAFRLVPDQTLRARLAEQAEQAQDAEEAEEGAGRPLPPPRAGEWQRWGSTAGIPGDALERLTERAVPQPPRTLTQPLRLSGAVHELPVTGVLCNANGSSIATVQALVNMGDPRLKVLADPRVSFLELGTGHWPMLSAPAELAEALLRAAAGEGHRLAPSTSEPAHRRPFLLEVPERARDRVGHVDLYVPGPDDVPAAEGGYPAVVFVHGGPVPRGVRPTPRDWPTFTGYARFVAGLGAVGVTVDHGLHDLTDYEQAAEDVAAAVDLVRRDPRVDGGRVALWFVSAGGLLAADWLAAPPAWLRCVAATYPVMRPLPNWGLADSRFHPATAVRTAGRLPIVLTRVELERPEIAVTVEEFLSAAKDAGADVEVVDVPQAHHGFETLDHTEPARHAVAYAVRTVLSHLRG